MGMHEHDHGHSHEHGDDDCCNFHKQIVRWIIKVSQADLIFGVVDDLMRPLPFLAQSLLSTAFISIVPIFFIYLLNKCCMRNEKTRESFTYIMLSFAIGGLLGDVFFHTLPHLSGGHDHDHGHHHEHDHGHHDEHGGHDHVHDHDHSHDAHDGHIHDEHDGHSHDEHSGHTHDDHSGHSHDGHAGHSHC